MKTVIHVKTGEYEFIEQEVEVDTPEAAVEAFRTLQGALNGGFGLPPKEWNASLDKYLKEGTLTSDEYDAMSSWQQKVIQEIKKSNKRINV